MSARMAWLLAALPAAVPASAATLCVNPSGGGTCHASVQAAVDAAAGGDTINIAPGAYYENVIVPAPKTGLRLNGMSRTGTILDGSPNSALGVTHTGVTLTIFASDVTVRNMTFRNGDRDAVALWNHRAIVQFVRFLSPDYSGVYILAGVTGTQVLNCEFRAPGYWAVETSTATGAPGTVARLNAVYGGGGGFYLKGDDVVASHNKVYQAGEGLNVYGANAAVQFNLVQGSSSGIIVEGSGPVVTNNRVLQAREDAIEVLGDEATVRSNSVTAAGGPALYVVGATATVTANTVRTAADYGVYVSGANPTVTSNNVKVAAGAGVSVIGATPQVRSNVVADAYEEGVRVAGANPTVERNRISNSAYIGLDVSCAPGCTSGLVAYNSVADAGATGIRLSADATGLVARYNSALRATTTSYLLTGVGIEASLNKATDQQSGELGGCFWVTGNGHLLAGNTATRCSGSAFAVFGNGHRLQDNLASYAGINGIEIATGTGNQITANKASFNNGAAFAVRPSASATNFTANDGTLGNRVGYCDDGTGTTQSGNSFGTAAPNCDLGLEVDP